MCPYHQNWVSLCIYDKRVHICCIEGVYVASNDGIWLSGIERVYFTRIELFRYGLWWVDLFGLWWTGTLNKPEVEIYEILLDVRSESIYPVKFICYVYPLTASSFLCVWLCGLWWTSTYSQNSTLPARLSSYIRHRVSDLIYQFTPHSLWWMGLYTIKFGTVRKACHEWGSDICHFVM